MSLWFLIILSAGVGILSARLWCYRKQMKHLKEQMEFLKMTKSNHLLTSACRAGRTEEVISDFNQVLENLREEERELRKSNRSYRESITSISHDIRTPLTSIKGYVEMMQEPLISEKKKEEYLAIIERRLDDLTELLNQLFEYARLEAGEMEWKPERVNAGNLFAEIIAMFYEDFLEKGYEPQVEISEAPCFVSVDSHAFVRIIENLMKNALMHGIGSYEFSLAEEKDWAVIRMSNETDTIEEKDMEQIFERFYTTDQSKSLKSTGLGLAIAQEFTVQMGGQIQAWLRESKFTVEVRFRLETV